MALKIAFSDNQLGNQSPALDTLGEENSSALSTRNPNTPLPIPLIANSRLGGEQRLKDSFVAATALLLTDSYSRAYRDTKSDSNRQVIVELAVAMGIKRGSAGKFDSHRYSQAELELAVKVDLTNGGEITRETAGMFHGLRRENEIVTTGPGYNPNPNSRTLQPLEPYPLPSIGELPGANYNFAPLKKAQATFLANINELQAAYTKFAIPLETYNIRSRELSALKDRGASTTDVTKKTTQLTAARDAAFKYVNEEIEGSRRIGFLQTSEVKFKAELNAYSKYTGNNIREALNKPRHRVVAAM